MDIKKIGFLILFFAMITSISYATQIPGLPDPSEFLYYSFLLMIIAILYSLTHKLNKSGKKIAFLIITIPVIISTLYLGGHTIYLNLISETGGPVHWHFDYEVWVCDEKLDLINPTGLTNRVGTSVLHEHNDERVHVEGVLVKKSDANLDAFFHTIGGDLHDDKLIFTTNDEVVSVKNGDTCPNGNPGTLQVFLYKTESTTFTQTKLEDFTNYIMSPESQVPPGDCIIVEFGEVKESTNKLCLTYQVAEENGDLVRG